MHVGFHRDRMRRAPEDLLRAWPTFTHTAEAGRAAGLEVILLQAAHRDAVLVQNGITCHFASDWQQLARRAAELNPRVIHIRGLSFPLQTRRLASALPDVPVVLQHHGDKTPPWWRQPLHAWGLSRISGVMSVAREQLEPFVRAHLFVAGTRFFEVLPASSPFEPGNVRAERRATGLHGDPSLVWVGRLDENKDPLTILDAVSRASLTLPKLQLWCCFTAAPLLEAVKQRIAEDPRLTNRVHLLGAVPHTEVEHLLRAADFMVLGSHRESCGFAVMEALACGVTPLVTDIPALRSMTAGGAVGALFPPGDAPALARLIISFATRDRTELRRQARAHFDKSLSFAALGAKLRAVYETLAASA